MNLFFNNLNSRYSKIKSLLCVGLDPEMEYLPEDLKKTELPFFEFNKLIIDNTHEQVLCYKPQFAHYSALGKEAELQRTINYIKENYPDIPVILDSKRGDIGNTAKHYAAECFDRYQSDATTVNPYMGYDSAEPFLERKDKGIFFLCKTSNPGASDFQNLIVESSTPLFVRVAQEINSKWNKNGNCGIVVGGTNLEDFSSIYNGNFNLPALIPGIGVQGGSVSQVHSQMRNESKFPRLFIFSVSRGIIYPDKAKSSNLLDYLKLVKESAINYASQTRDFTF